MDHFIKEQLRCRYLRYMDDFVLLHHDKAFLWQAKQAIVEYLRPLGLALHEAKCRIFTTAHGVPFLGLVIFPHRRRLKHANLIRFKRRLRRFQVRCYHGSMTVHAIGRSVRAWMGHAMHAETGQLRKLVLADAVFRPRKGD